MKSLKRIISTLLGILLVLGLIPITSFNNGKGVYAATGEEIVTDALSFAVENDYQNPKTPKLNYVWGGLDLTVGCDCSGFVCAIFKRHGLDLVAMNIRSSYDMLAKATDFGTIVNGTDPSLIQSGDILITNSGGHAAIGWNNNGVPYMIHCQNHKMGCVYQPMSTYNSGIVMIIRPYVITGQGGNVNPPSDGGGSSSQVPDTENPGYPYAIPTATVTSGNAAKWLQTALNKLMNSGLVVDGSIGSLTKAATSDFQTAYGLPATGVADMTTVNKMVEAYKGVCNVKSVTLKGFKKTTIDEDSSIQLFTTIDPATAIANIEWSSSDSNVLSVTSTGMMTAVGPGTATITAKAANGKSATAKFTVNGKKRYSEWYGGQWYGSDGNTDYEYKGYWMQNSTGWWFTDDSGWYPANEWVKIDKKWYFFDSNGYIVSKGWRQIGGDYYYFKDSCDMAESEWIGGYWLSGNGKWTYAATGSWKQNTSNKTWWFEDTSGWYPKSEVVQIDNVRYFFNPDGYWLTN